MNDDFYERAFLFARRYCEIHPEFTVSDTMPFIQGNSHRVVRGHNDTYGPVVFKFFANPASRQREIAALRHFANRSPVPTLLDDSADRLLVMTEITGTTLRNNPAPAVPVFRDLGHVLAKMTRLQIVDQEAAREHYLARRQRHGEAARVIQTRDRSYNNRFFRYSLRLAESLPLPTVFSLGLQDVNPSNLLVVNRSLNGIVDLEGTLPNSPLSQAGVSLFACAVYSDELNFPAYRLWRPFLKGWQEEQGTLSAQDRLLLLAAAYERAWSLIHAEGAGGATPPPSWFYSQRAHRMQRWMQTCHDLALGKR